MADNSVARNQWRAWYVANDVDLDPELTLALMEALWAESSFHNYANDGVRGPEDDSGTASTDAQLRTAAETMALPHDLVGTDHASAGCFSSRQDQASAGVE